MQISLFEQAEDSTRKHCRFMLPAISVYFGKWKLQFKTKWKCLPCLLTHLLLHMLLNSVVLVGCYLIAICMKYMRCTTFLSVCVQRNKISTGSVYQVITLRQLWTLTKTSKSKAQIDGHMKYEVKWSWQVKPAMKWGRRKSESLKWNKNNFSGSEHSVQDHSW